MYKNFKKLISSSGFGTYSLAFDSVLGVFFYKCGQLMSALNCNELQWRTVIL